jgi:hypothetical protein
MWIWAGGASGIVALGCEMSDGEAPAELLAEQLPLPRNTVHSIPLQRPVVRDEDSLHFRLYRFESPRHGAPGLSDRLRLFQCLTRRRRRAATNTA